MSTVRGRREKVRMGAKRARPPSANHRHWWTYTPSPTGTVSVCACGEQRQGRWSGNEQIDRHRPSTAVRQATMPEGVIRSMAARFAGACGHCGEAIEVGSTINLVAIAGMKVWVCPTCVVDVRPGSTAR